MSQVPHACFQYSSPVRALGSHADRDLVRDLECRLRSRFGNARLINRIFLPTHVIVGDVEGCSFSICITKNRYKSDERIVLLATWMDAPS